MFRIKRSILILLLSCVVMLCGCSQSTQSVSDELRSNSWYAKNKNGTEIFLSFDMNYAELEFVGTDKMSSAEISGACVVSDSSFIITDTSMGEIIYFTYTISGDKATVCYRSQEIVFTKVKSEESEENISQKESESDAQQY